MIDLEKTSRPITFKLRRSFSKLGNLSGNSDQSSVSVPYLPVFLQNTVIYKTRTENTFQPIRIGQIANIHR